MTAQSFNQHYRENVQANSDAETFDTVIRNGLQTFRALFIDDIQDVPAICAIFNQKKKLNKK